MTDLADLIARVESAQGPDRGLDADIALAVGIFTERHYQAWWHFQECGEAANPPFAAPCDPSPYTASVDAALTLVPEGCLACVRTLWDGITHEKTAGLATVDTYANNYWQAHFQGTATTPALALCTAALRAIAAQGEG